MGSYCSLEEQLFKMGMIPLILSGQSKDFIITNTPNGYDSGQVAQITGNGNLITHNRWNWRNDSTFIRRLLPVKPMRRLPLLNH